MMDALIRMLLVGALIGVTFAAVRSAERRRHLTGSPFSPGLTLVVGPGCALCGPAEHALRALGAVPKIIDVRETPSAAVSRSLPTAIVTNQKNMVVMQRSGRSVIADASEIVRSASAALSTAS